MLNRITKAGNQKLQTINYKLLATGGGAHNTFLIERLQAALQPMQVEVMVPDKNIIDYNRLLFFRRTGFYYNQSCFC